MNFIEVKLIPVEEILKIYPQQLTASEFCTIHHIDVVSNGIHKKFWDILSGGEALIDDQMLQYLGYTGERYVMSFFFKKFLMEPQNANIKYRLKSVNNSMDIYDFVIYYNWDFWHVINQNCNSNNSMILHSLWSGLSRILYHFQRYQEAYKNHLSRLLVQQNLSILEEMKELGSILNKKYY
jgi:hypothetical protein